jgi:hypothetical protein
MACGTCYYFAIDDDPGSFDTCVNDDSEYYGIPIISDDMCNCFKEKEDAESENDLEF